MPVQLVRYDNDGALPPPGVAELHRRRAPQVFWPFFHNGCDAEKPAQGERLQKRLSWVEGKLGDRAFLMGSGETFTVADCYPFTVVSWIRPAGLDLVSGPGCRSTGRACGISRR